jgi:hypothetical protein
MREEIVYIDRDNDISLQLSVGDPVMQSQVIKHNMLTRCQVLVGVTLLDSATTPALFDFTDAARLTLKFSQAGLTPGRYAATLFVFDNDHPNGLNWGHFVLRVKH